MPAIRASALAAVFFASHIFFAQAYTPPPPPLTTAPCVPTKKEPCTTQTHPAPTSLPPATADKFPFPGEPPTPARGDNAQPNPSTPTATNPNPFPGEPSDASSSSSKPDTAPVPGEPTPEDGDKSALKDAGSTGSTRFQRRQLAKVEDLDRRELEDIDVSRYYISTGNFPAAYARAQDALRLYPEDENAHLVLAVAAEKLKKKDEAVSEYKAYLKLAPDGDKAKQAQRAVALLTAK